MSAMMSTKKMESEKTPVLTLFQTALAVGHKHIKKNSKITSKELFLLYFYITLSFNTLHLFSHPLLLASEAEKATATIFISFLLH